MSRPFKLIGNIPAKLSQIEKILPRIMSRMSTKTYGVIPSSVVAFHKEVVQPGEVIFRCGMFKGKLRKLLFLLDPLEGKAVPEYILTLVMGMEERKIKVNTKRLDHIMEVDIDIPDGSIVEVKQVAEEVTLKNVYVTALIDFEQDTKAVHDFVIDKLLEDTENEGI